MSSGIAYGWLVAVWDGSGVGIRWRHWQIGHALMGVFFSATQSQIRKAYLDKVIETSSGQSIWIKCVVAG